MHKSARWGLAGVALTTALFLFFESHMFADPPQAPKSDREAITAVLNAQESAWNRDGTFGFFGIGVSIFGAGRCSRPRALAFEARK